MSDLAAADADAGTDTNTDTNTDTTGKDTGTANADANSGKDNAASTSAANGDGAGDNVVWPDNWKQEIAGADDPDGKRLTRLGRFDHPGRIFDSFLEIETKYKGADIRTSFTDEGSDEDKAK